MTNVKNGFLWSGIDYIAFQSIQFILSIIIARLVTPEAYGVVVIAMVFMTFAQLFIDGGFQLALVQKKDRSEIDYYTVFIFNLIVAVILYTIIFISAPYIAIFYDNIILKDITRVIALNLIFSSLSITQLTRIQVDLNFKLLTKVRIISIIISGTIGIICAYNGMETWALVIQNILGAFLTSILLMYFSRWIPKLRFSVRSFKQLFSFGVKILFSNFLTTAYIQLTNLIIGRYYTSANLAYYNRGFNIGSLPATSLSEIISRIVYPILCKSQDDIPNLICEFKKYVRLSCLLIFPIMVFLSLLSKQLVIILLTERWIGVAPLLSIFAYVFLFYPLTRVSMNAVLAAGRAKLMATSTVIKRSVAIVIMLISITISVEAVAIGVLISTIIETFINMICVKMSLAVSLKEQCKYIKDILASALIAGGAAAIMLQLFDNIYAQLLLGGIIYSTIYIVCIYIFQMPEICHLNQIIDKIKSIKLK